MYYFLYHNYDSKNKAILSKNEYDRDICTILGTLTGGFDLDICGFGGGLIGIFDSFSSKCFSFEQKVRSQELLDTVYNSKYKFFVETVDFWDYDEFYPSYTDFDSGTWINNYINKYIDGHRAEVTKFDVFKVQYHDNEWKYYDET